MKITNEQLTALEQSEARKKSKVAEDAFSSLLAQQIDDGQAQGVASALDTGNSGSIGLQINSLTMPLSLSPVESAEQASMDLQVAAVQIDSIFSDMEEYADKLGQSQNTNLRDVYSLLQGMSDKVASLKDSYPDMPSASPELSSMVNELEVMTSTEMFKFNRGDYL